MSQNYVPNIVTCVFVEGVKKDDAEELAECFRDTKMVSFHNLPGGRTCARYSVPTGHEDEFLEYAEDDTIVETASRGTAIGHCGEEHEY